MIHLELMAIRQQVGPAKLRDQRQTDEILELAEARLLDRKLDFLPAEPSLRLEAEDELILQRRAITRHPQLLLADPHGRSHRHVALSHLLFLPQRIALRPALHHPLTLDFHSHISTST